MAELVSPDIAVYICANGVSGRGGLPNQWTQDGVHVLVREIPCSGKMDVQYLLHALEGGARGLCVVACPPGQCQLAQGNSRAEVRVGTVRRLLKEMNLEPERVELLHVSPDDPVQQRVREAVSRICALGPSPLCPSNGEN